MKMGLTCCVLCNLRALDCCHTFLGKGLSGGKRFLSCIGREFLLSRGFFEWWYTSFSHLLGFPCAFHRVAASETDIFKGCQERCRHVRQVCVPFLTAFLRGG